MTSADVVVIGAGAIGACVAYELTLAGADVQVVDQGTRPAAGCSQANAGLLAPSHSEPLTGAANIRTGLARMMRPDSAFHVRPSLSLLPWLTRYALASKPSRVDDATRVLRDLGAAGLRRHATYLEHGLGTSFEQRGLLDVFAGVDARDAAAASLASHPLDFEYDLLTDTGVRELTPGIASTAGGILFRHEAHCDSRVFVEAVLSAAGRRGARVTFGARVRGLDHGGGRVRGVRTRDGVVRAGHVVIAAGHLSAALTRQLGVRIPLAPAKGYVIDIETRPGDPRLPVGLKKDLVVVTPYPDRIRLAGTLELVGADRSVDAGRSGTIRAAANRAFPSLKDRRTLSVWTGLRPCSADGLPIVGPAHAVDGVTVATGHGQQGLLLAPATGQLVAAQVTGHATPVPGDRLGPERFRPGRRRSAPSP